MASMMRTWTIDEMLAERPCPQYDRARITELWAGRETLSVLDTLDLDIPPADKVWVACRPGAISAQIRTAWSLQTATRAVTDHARACGVPAVEAWARAWLSGADRTAAAAREAAREAAEAGAWAARAAEAGAWAALAAAAEAEERERERQVADLRALLEASS